MGAYAAILERGSYKAETINKNALTTHAPWAPDTRAQLQIGRLQCNSKQFQNNAFQENKAIACFLIYTEMCSNLTCESKHSKFLSKDNYNFSAM